MIVDCISDLHGHYPELDGGDLLIVAGDLTARNEVIEYMRFHEWIRKQKYKKVILVPGNHDKKIQEGFLHTDPKRGVTERWLGFKLLCDSGTEFEYFDDRFPAEDEGFLPSGKRTLKIWGSPWTKRFPGMNPKCMAFTCETDEELAEKWVLIPKDTSVLITHSPSFGNHDWVKNRDGTLGPSVGSITLWMQMLTMVPNLKLHITGHIHEAYGQSKHENGIHLVNASHVNEHCEPVNKPIRVIL